MDAKAKLNLEVNTELKLNIPNKTAYECATILEFWLNENKDNRELEYRKAADGKWLVNPIIKDWDKEDSFDMMPQSEGGTSQWISVKNKLPDIEQEVLIQLSWDDMNVVMGMLTNDGWKSNVASFKDDEVLYWQPLPTPYIESENKEIKKAAVVEND